MKIMAVSERWWPDGTGGILASHLIARLLQDAGFKLTVVHGTGEPIRLNGVHYVYSSLLSVRNKQRLWLNCLILARKRWFLKLVSVSDIVYIPRYCYPLIPIAREFGKKVVVHLHDYQPVSYSAVMLKNGDRIIPRGFRDIFKLEILEHSSILRALGTMSAPLNSFCRLWLKEADSIICVSKKQVETVGMLAPELASRLKVVYNPLPNVPFVEKKLSGHNFLYLGGDSYFKGFHIFLGASRKILKRRPLVKFLIAGTFKKNLQSNNAYRILGYIGHEEVLKFHGISYALLFPSVCEEPLPYAVMESMAVGTLPISSRVGGVPEILNGTLAERMMCEPNDIDKFTEQVEYVLSMDREQLKDIGLSLREAILKRFNQESIKNELVKAFLG